MKKLVLIVLISTLSTQLSFTNFFKSPYVHSTLTKTMLNGLEYSIYPTHTETLNFLKNTHYTIRLINNELTLSFFGIKPEVAIQYKKERAGGVKTPKLGGYQIKLKTLYANISAAVCNDQSIEITRNISRTLTEPNNNSAHFGPHKFTLFSEPEHFALAPEHKTNWSVSLKKVIQEENSVHFLFTLTKSQVRTKLRDLDLALNANLSDTDLFNRQFSNREPYLEKRVAKNVVKKTK